MPRNDVRRLGSLLVTAAVLGSVAAAAVAVPVTAARPRCDGKVATIVSSKKVIRGTNKADVIVATGTKNNTIYGKGGADRICAGAGRDRIFGGDGNDRLFGGAGSDVCIGGAGFDRVFGCNEPATTGTMPVTRDMTLAAPHKGEISIDADGVRLDCAGHTITGPGSGIGIEIIGRRDVTIVNCHPTGFGAGIHVQGSTGIVIRRSSADKNGEGVRIQDSTATLTSNTANRNGTWGFILVNETTGTQLTGNLAVANARIGFGLNNADGTVLERNQARANAEANFDLYLSNRNTLRANTAKGRGIGFHVGDSNGNTLRANRALGTDRRGTTGFMVNAARQNRLVGNMARDYERGFSTFDAPGMTSGNRFRANAAKSNAVGFSDGTAGSGTKGTANTYLDNSCVANRTNSDPRGLC